MNEFTVRYTYMMKRDEIHEETERVEANSWEEAAEYVWNKIDSQGGDVFRDIRVSGNGIPDDDPMIYPV